MANVRDSDTSLWLHNKLGTSNDSWISGSICSQLNKEVLRNVKECFPDLQTQVKLKFLLTFFHIPRRLIDEWKAELEEIIEVACLDTELWVAMLAETMKTFPATSSLNTEISEYEDTRPIFTDMVNDLRKLVNKHSDLGMLPLECQYLNKNALVSVVGQQPNPVKHFTLKRKPKSANLRTELLHKSADAQSSLKKASAPTIPLRSRGMPRKMTDTTPLKGIPSRMPTSGFRTPNMSGNQQRPNVSRTPAGRKDGGIKLIEFTDQPLGYAAAKKRKREQQLEEQQKKQEQKQNAAAAAAAAGSSSPTSLPVQTTTASSAAGTPTTPTSTNASFEIKAESSPHFNQSGSGDEMNVESKEFVSQKTEPATPDYAPPTLTYTQPTVSAVDDTKMESKKANANISGTSLSTQTVSKVTSTSVQTQSNNVTRNHKRIKQEIEIKSEEIIVPATIKVEKIEPQTPTRNAQSQRPQQRVIIQQQQQSPSTQQGLQTQHVLIRAAPQQKTTIGGLTLTNNANNARLNTIGATTIKMEKIDLKSLTRSPSSSVTGATATGTATLSQQQIRQTVNPLANLPNNISVKITSAKATKNQVPNQTPALTSQNQQPILINSSTPVIISSSGTQASRQKQLVTSNATTATTQTIKSMPLSQLKSATNSGPVIISQTIIQPAKRNVNAAGQTLNQQQQQQQQQSQQQQQTQQQANTQYILTTPSSQQTIQNSSLPTLSSFTQARGGQQTLYTPGSSTTSTIPSSTKILLKTTPNSGVMIRQQPTTAVNPPPLVASSTPIQQSAMLNIQNVQLPNRPVTIQPASQAAQQQHMQAQLQQQQPQLTVVSNAQSGQQSNLANATANAKNKTIYLTQKGVFLRNIGGDVYQQIPISNVSGLQNIGTGTTLMTTAAGPPSLVKTTPSNLQTQTIQIQQSPSKQQIPTLISTNTVAPQHMIVQQQPTQTSLITNTAPQTIIRPVMQNVQTGLTTLPLTLIQRPGQQPQLVQVQTTPSTQQPPQIQRTIITQPAQHTQQIRPQQHILLQHKPVQQRLITTPANIATGGQTQQIQIQQSPTLSGGARIVQVTQQQQQQTAAPQRKGLSLSNEHVHKAHEMFRKANRVSRPDKALILGFMAGMRENPRPNSENVIVIKLGETEEKVQQEDGSTALCLVESHIRLDYNTGEWKTFQNYRRQNPSDQSNDNNAGMMQTPSSVVI